MHLFFSSSDLIPKPIKAFKSLPYNESRVSSSLTLGFLIVYAFYLVILLIVTGLLQKRPGSSYKTINDFFQYVKKGRRRIAMVRSRMLVFFLSSTPILS